MKTLIAMLVWMKKENSANLIPMGTADVASEPSLLWLQLCECQMLNASWKKERCKKRTFVCLCFLHVIESRNKGARCVCVCVCVCV